MYVDGWMDGWTDGQTSAGVYQHPPYVVRVAAQTQIVQLIFSIF